MVRYLADLIGQRTRLVADSSGNLSGWCPLCQPQGSIRRDGLTVPTLIVFLETDSWHCMGCGAGGDVFTWLMLTQGLTFGEALQALQAHMSLPPERSLDGTVPLVPPAPNPN